MWKAGAAIGGVLNHLFDPATISQRTIGFFRRVYDAPPPGGAFVFDVLEPGQVPLETTTRGSYEGEDWVALVEQEGDAKRVTLTRRVSRLGRWRSAKGGKTEHPVSVCTNHRMRVGELRGLGFRVRTMRGYVR